jgi:hypothetical protein
MASAISKIDASDISRAKGIDGLLGLDYLRGQRLEIDFVRGLVSLA